MTHQYAHCNGALDTPDDGQKRADLSQLLRQLASECAGGVHKRDNGEAKVVGMAHEAQGLAVPIGLGHAEVAVDVFLQDTLSLIGRDRFADHSGLHKAVIVGAQP